MRSHPCRAKISAKDPPAVRRERRQRRSRRAQTIRQTGELVLASTPHKLVTAELFDGSLVAGLSAGLAPTTPWIVLLDPRTEDGRRMGFDQFIIKHRQALERSARWALRLHGGIPPLKVQRKACVYHIGKEATIGNVRVGSRANYVQA